MFTNVFILEFFKQIPLKKKSLKHHISKTFLPAIKELLMLIDSLFDEDIKQQRMNDHSQLYLDVN